MILPPESLNPGIIFTTVLYISVFYNLGGTVKSLWQRGNTILRVLLASFAAMVVAANIQLFGAVQFRTIVRQVGGGKPETAYIRLSAKAPELAQVLNIQFATNVTTSNQLFGPIAILLRSDKEIVFVNDADLHPSRYNTNYVATLVTNIFNVRTTNLTTSISTNQLNQPITNITANVITTFTTNLEKTVRTNILKTIHKPAAKQVRAELVDAVIFTR